MMEEQLYTNVILGEVDMTLHGEKDIEVLFSYEFYPETERTFYNVIPKEEPKKGKGKCSHENVCCGISLTKYGLMIEVLMCSDCLEVIDVTVEYKKDEDTLI